MTKVIPKKFTQIQENFSMKGWGAEKADRADVWMSHLITPLEEKFKDGLSLLDYGCGNGRLANFLSGRLKNFTYYGVEPPNTLGLSVAKKTFGEDPRVNFGEIDSAFEKEAIFKVESVILGSIFTHLDFDEFKRVLSKFIPVVFENDGVIIASYFFGPKYKVFGTGNAYGVKNCYSVVQYVQDDFNKVVESFGLKQKKYDSYTAQKVHKHHIIKLFR